MVTLPSPHVATSSKCQAAWMDSLINQMRGMGWATIDVEHSVVADITEHRAEVDSCGLPRAMLELQHPVLCGCDAVPPPPS